MKKYRNKPEVIDAVQVPARGYAYSDEIVELVKTQNWGYYDDGIMIDARDGSMLASPGYFIIRKQDGSYDTCSPYVFAATYEETVN